MTALIVAASVMLAHITGFIEVIAPPLGAIGTVLTTADHAVADTISIKNYVATKRAAHKKVVRK